MLKIRRQKSFIKDLSKIKMSNNHYTKYISYISKLLNNETLPPEAKEHHLHGKWTDTREFHISGDMLVIYFIDNNNDELVLVRIGSHSNLF